MKYLVTWYLNGVRWELREKTTLGECFDSVLYRYPGARNISVRTARPVGEGNV